MDYGGELNIQYVEMGGVAGVFIKLDAAVVDEHTLEGILQAAQHQIRMMVRACREGSTVQRDIYIRASDRSKKAKRCLCRYCDDMFYCRADLVAHQTKEHPTLPLRLGKKSRKPCPTCGKVVLNLALHIRTKHTSDPVVNYNTGLAQCRQCEETYPVNTDHASVCRLSPTCPDCNKTFSQWRVMNKHRKIVHMGEKISCNSCNKTYHDAQSLKKHMEAVHLKLKRVCPLCGATVTTLSGHMNAVHADVRNFPCTSCDKKFKSNYDLTRHRDSVHLGQKPPCPICGKHLSNLNQHIRIVHKQIRFGCTMCSKQLNTKSELQKHIQKMHGDSTSTRNQQYLHQKYSSQEMRHIEPVHHPQHQPQQQQQLLTEDSYMQSQRDMTEEQLIAQYLGKQSFILPSNPLKQEVLNDPMILCKEEQLLLKQDMDLLGQSRLTLDTRQMDMRQTDLRQQDLRQDIRLEDLRPVDNRHTEIRQGQELRQQSDMRTQDMRQPELRQDLRQPDMRLQDLRDQQDMRQVLDINRINQELERHDLELERQGLTRPQGHPHQRQMMSPQMDVKLSNELDPPISRNYQPTILTTVHQLPPWNHPLHSQTKPE